MSFLINKLKFANQINKTFEVENNKSLHDFTGDSEISEENSQFEEYKLQLVNAIKEKKMEDLGINLKNYRETPFNEDKLGVTIKVNEKFNIFAKSNREKISQNPQSDNFKFWDSPTYRVRQEEEKRLKVEMERTELEEKKKTEYEKEVEKKKLQSANDKKSPEQKSLDGEETCKNFYSQSRKTPFNIINGDGENFNFAGMTVRSLVNANYEVSEKTEELLSKDLSNQTNVPKTINFLNYNPTFDNLPYLCALESAARHNKDHYIKFYVRDKEDFYTVAEDWLNKINFKFRFIVLPLNFAEKFSNTPFESWYEEKKYMDSEWQMQNLGNAFRLALIWKNGGVYLDTDIISINSFKDLKHSRLVAREDSSRINNAVLSFPPKDPYIWSAMELFVNNWNGHTWGNNGPLCLTRAMIRDCNWNSLASAKMELFEIYRPNVTVADIESKKLAVPNNEPTKKGTPEREEQLANNRKYLEKYGNHTERPYCSSITVASRIRFYPIHYSQSNFFLKDWWKNCNFFKYIYEKSIGVHWWNRMFKFKNTKTNLSPNSTIAKIFNDQCPVYMQVYGLQSIG
ncbi:hypothetical protein HK099_004049 [Clydaea vesicula]|uniref:Alpha 1,4-glycosyltransferase domain-containing protein n=1 Tax=Clydaea vesicula TaxID=447962 RepID=A0AAD5U3N3_9FUNG|nr:hypothetical protein HK099_004049 [Clydaea vesicula]